MKSMIETSLSASILLRMRQFEDSTVKPDKPAGILSALGAPAKEPKIEASETKQEAKVIIAETTDKVVPTPEHQPTDLFADITGLLDQKVMQFERPRVGDLVKWESSYSQEDSEKLKLVGFDAESN